MAIPFHSVQSSPVLPRKWETVYEITNAHYIVFLPSPPLYYKCTRSGAQRDQDEAPTETLRRNAATKRLKGCEFLLFLDILSLNWMKADGGWMKAPLLDEAQLGGRRTPTNGFAMYNSAAFAFQRQGPPPSFHPDYTPPPPSSGKCTHFTILVSVDAAAVVVLLLMYTCSDLCQVRLDLLRSQSLSPSRRRLLLFAR